ncbi:MAG: hypothetical protein ACK5EA_28835 [Planctomycetaceae bacterium]|jgi:hypothetical protein
MSLAVLARQFYESELKARLEPIHSGEYVAIVPHFREFFIASSFVAAALAARAAHPDQTPFVIRVGHDAAFHIGAAMQ